MMPLAWYNLQLGASGVGSLDICSLLGSQVNARSFILVRVSELLAGE